MRRQTERTGLMVVRIWFEDSGVSLRARLTETSDLDSAEQTSRVAASIDEVVEIVRDWVEEFVAAAR